MNVHDLKRPADVPDDVVDSVRNSAEKLHRYCQGNRVLACMGVALARDHTGHFTAHSMHRVADTFEVRAMMVGLLRTLCHELESDIRDSMADEPDGPSDDSDDNVTPLTPIA